jgi:signal transduction histidine kinase
MENLTIPVKTALQTLVERLIKNLLPVATRNNSFIVNDVSPKLCVGVDENAVMPVISGLLQSVINNARETSIRITAKEVYGKMVVVSVKDNNSYNTYGVACSLQDVVPMAQRIGGQLDISSEKQNVTTIAFRFPVTSD